MNIGIITSTIVAGILILILAVTNLNIQSSAQELVISQMKQVQTTAVSDIISNDFPKIGYASIGDIDSAITSANSTSITFYSNLDNSGDNSIEKVTWEFLTTEIATTDNPNDKVLRRSVNGDVTDIEIGVVDFEIRYYSSFGSTTPMVTPISSANLATIRQIEVEVTLQSSENISSINNNTPTYVQNTWVKRFTPRNLTSNF